MNDMPIPLKAAWGLIKSATQSWVDDYASSMGAALAYYTLFSLAPLLLIVIALAGLVFGPDAARGEILGQLRELMGEDSARAVQAMLEAANQPGKGVAATVNGTVFLLIGATSVFVELRYALDRIWRAPGAPVSVGDYDKALKHMQRALEIESHWPENQLYMAELEFRLGKKKNDPALTKRARGRLQEYFLKPNVKPPMAMGSDYEFKEWQKDAHKLVEEYK